jgi:hypothetical protein
VSRGQSDRGISAGALPALDDDDVQLLELVARLPLAPLSVIECFTDDGRASAYRRITRLIDRGLVSTSVSPFRSSGRPPRLFSTTRLGLDTLARSRALDPHVLARRSGAERLQRTRLMAELPGRLAAYELLRLLALAQPGEVTLVNWERPWRRVIGPADVSIWQATPVIRLPAAATLDWASSGWTLAREYLLVPDTGGLAIPALRATLARLAQYQSDVLQSQSILVVATTTARRATAWTRLVESASTGRGLPTLAYEVRLWDDLRRLAEVGRDAGSRVAGTQGVLPRARSALTVRP